MFQRICALVAIVSFALLLTANQARAIVVAANDYDDSAHVTPPTDGNGHSLIPYFSNVGDMGTDSGNNSGAVYLGNGWCICAWHEIEGGLTSESHVTFNGTQTIAADLTTTPIHLTDSNGTQIDAGLFRLSSDPGLPTLPLNLNGANVDDHIYMVGYGGHTTDGTSYNSSGVPYVSSDTSERWGENIVNYSSGDGFKAAFISPDSGGIPNEAQAFSGDSGGGVFADDGTLVGIISTGDQGNIPVPFGGYNNGSGFVRISYALRLKIASITETGLPGDVNGDGAVDQNDLDIALSALGLTQKQLIACDLNGDGIVDANDYTIFSIHLGESVAPFDGDINGDGRVDSRDVEIIVVFEWEQSGENLPGDVNDDGVVDYNDYIIVSDNLGKANPVGDINRDFVVDSSDYDILNDYIGLEVEGLQGDVNGDGVVDQTDIDIIVNNWTSNTPPVLP